MRTTLQVDRRAGFSKVLLIIGAVVVLGSVALGVAVAYALTGTAKGAAAPAAAPAGKGSSALAEYDYVPFGSVVANLSEGRLTRYLQVSLILKVQKASAEALKKVLAGGEKAVFRDWLITYLSDKRLDEVGGASAITRLQREIQEGFNAILAQNGGCKVEAVLFEEFNIQ